MRSIHAIPRKDFAKTTVKISSERKRERERENGRTRGKTSRREMEINAQPARGNSNEIRIFERYPAITFDVQFNELIVRLADN